ncbi:DUF421 domain-containing protein [Ammoniphilus resinae]|uniref:Uncharacterized membrane protein YcaP (DUF421 family) n=1 Tax=Ammoniphilus resinae TaxID=861532 RepID=A0ABS4GLM2_9BACL|nr:YetF domain-containing protein [Ammoniphilus resinae]MBP1931146.1 uncharacterized membrane protein YcaP (DUF421 family) [Ammoniphilus resinae]
MWTIFWQALLLAFVGTILVRLGGRKSVSQMTTAQLAVLLGLGTILGSEVAGKGLAKTILASATFIGFLALAEWISLRSNRAEGLIKGKAIPVIINGNLVVSNLKALRMSVDDLEKRLRMAGISRIEDVKSGTIEDNGELGYELMPHARPVTRGDLEKILKANFPQAIIPSETAKDNIFTEVNQGSHDYEVPEQLH